MAKTSIEWATDVWNPVSGCTKVSAGCKNCYAEKIAKRFWGDRKFTDVQCHEERLYEPFHWKKPRRVFVNSMSDLFHPDVPEEFIYRVFRIMASSKHTYIILTKRPLRMNNLMMHIRERLISDHFRESVADLPNVWLGVSVENQHAADERIPSLIQTSAAVRFVSVEPMLEAVDLRRGIYSMPPDGDPRGTSIEGIDWVICGCESGQNARPFDMDWARSLRDQCQNAGVPFFFKQGRVGGKLAKMPELDGIVWNELPKRSN